MKLKYLFLFILLSCPSILFGQYFFNEIAGTGQVSGCDGCVVYEIDSSFKSFVYTNKPEKVSIPFLIEGQEHTFTLDRNYILSDQFKVNRSSGKSSPFFKGVFYSGYDDEGNKISLSLFDDEVITSVYLTDKGNYSMSKEGAYYLMSLDTYDNPFECNPIDSGEPYTQSELSTTSNISSTVKCPTVGFEVDYDIYQDKGSVSSVVNYVTSLYNQVYSVYQVNSIEIKLGELYVWDTESPYEDKNSYNMLLDFRENKKVSGGDVFQLLSYKSSGGIAYLNVLCSIFDNNISFSSIRSSFTPFPSYSWSVMVIAHELGHNLGSRHTHSCAWNGDNTAIDGCPGFTEGSCDTPDVPVDGGTVMSYCHINPVGINLSKGFHEQPANVIKNKINSANCIGVCDTSGDGGNDDDDDNGDDNNNCKSVLVNLKLDMFGSETEWGLLDVNSDTLVYFDSDFENKTEGAIISKEFCLPEGCYEFFVSDSYGDGLCCGYGDGHFKVFDNNGVLFEADNFDSFESYQLCVENEEEEPVCPSFNFELTDIKPYGGVQDKGTYSVLSDSVLLLEGNSWKYIDFEYYYTSNTIIEFDFKSSIEGEIHGVGFDNDTGISPNTTFRVFGIQNWGRGDYDNYDISDDWVTYVIPVPSSLSGNYDKFFFVNDKDIGFPKGNSYFRNVRVYESGECESSEITTYKNRVNSNKLIKVIPNPANKVVNFILPTGTTKQSKLQIFSTSGQLIDLLSVDYGVKSIELDVLNYTSGVYIFKYISGSYVESGRFIKTNN